MEKPYTIMVLLEAQAEQINPLKQALTDIIKPSQMEEACVECRLHQDLDNPAKFMLYENWANKAGHEAHMQQPHITNLIGQLGMLLAKPFQIVFAEEIGNI